MKTASPLFLALALSMSTAACGSDSDGSDGAYLTIQGDSSVYLDPGTEHPLAVKYHDAQGNPLIGEVSFELLGDPRGSTISKDYGATNSYGEAKLTVFSSEVESVFRIKASAEDAAPVEWTVSVSESVVREMDIRGSYDVDSEFNLVGVLPGKVGDAVDAVTELTDDPYDPATYILDKILDDQSEFVVTAAEALRPALDGILNDAIKDSAPNAANDLLELGNDFGQIARKFGLVSLMDISGDGIEDNNMRAFHTITGMNFRIDNDTYEYSMAELGGEIYVANNISVDHSMETGEIEFAQHSVVVEYGELLAVALEEVLVPRVDSSAKNLEDLLNAQIDCEAIGEQLADNVEIFGDNFYEGACLIAVKSMAESILEDLRDIDKDKPVKLLITGDAFMKDVNNNRRADRITKGQWRGFLDYSGSQSPLADGENPFTGVRAN